MMPKNIKYRAICCIEICRKVLYDELISSMEVACLKGKIKAQQITIECPNTIFHLYIRTDNEMSKLEIFMRNLRTVERLELIDIYQWCNRQRILYDTAFHYRRDNSLWKNMRSYLHYSSQKMKYKVRFRTA